MQIGQAIISSVDSKTEQRNELVSRSHNIDDQLGQCLCRWSPCRQELAFGQTESTNFFATDCGKLALSRSVIGGRESSRCGGQRVVTYVVVFDPSQLSGYHNNVVLLARSLRSMGKLILQTHGTPQLPMLDVPDRSFQEPNGTSRPELSISKGKIVRAIEIHRQLVIIGEHNPLTFLGAFLAALPLHERMQYSFATGLNVIEHRPFNIQFFAESTPILAKQLASRQLRTIDLTPKAVFSH